MADKPIEVADSPIPDLFSEDYETLKLGELTFGENGKAFATVEFDGEIEIDVQKAASHDDAQIERVAHARLLLPRVGPGFSIGVAAA